MPLAPDDILRAWEVGSARHPIDRALTLLWAAAPAGDRDVVASLAIGERDRRLLALHEAAFGDRLDCIATCPACAAKVEFELSARGLRQDTATPPDATTVVGWGELRIEIRSLDSCDLAAAASAPDGTAERVLLERAVVAVRRESGQAADDLPPAARAAVAAALAERDPAADIELQLDCPECGHAWSAAFDIAHFLWGEVETEAARLLREVAALARSYGWRERDILAMSPVRRRAYLDLSGVA